MSKMEEQRRQKRREKELRKREAALLKKSEHLRLKQERLMQLQNQKKTTEQQKSHLLKAAENLRFVNMQSDDLLETAGNHAGVFQLSTSVNNSEIASVEKEEENDARNGKTSGKRKQPDEELIDLTLDDDEEGLPGATPSKQPRLEDIKPDKEELDRQINEGIMADITNQVDEDMDKTVNDKSLKKEGGFPDKCLYYKSSEKFSEKEIGETKEQNVASESKRESNKEMTKEEKMNVQIYEARKSKAEEKKQNKLTVSNSLHTKTKEKQILARKEKDSESDSRQRDEELKKMYASKCSAEQKLKCLQEKVHKLLKIMVPDLELSDTKDIEDVVDEMIRVNA